MEVQQEEWEKRYDRGRWEEQRQQQEAAAAAAAAAEEEEEEEEEEEGREGTAVVCVPVVDGDAGQHGSQRGGRLEECL